MYEQQAESIKRQPHDELHVNYRDLVDLLNPSNSSNGEGSAVWITCVCYQL